MRVGQGHCQRSFAPEGRPFGDLLERGAEAAVTREISRQPFKRRAEGWKSPAFQAAASAVGPNPVLEAEIQCWGLESNLGCSNPPLKASIHFWT